MEKYTDEFDMALHERINSIRTKSYQKSDIKNIIKRAKIEKRRKIYFCSSVISFIFIAIGITTLSLRYIKNDIVLNNVIADNEQNLDLNINNDNEIKPLAELYQEEYSNVLETIVYKTIPENDSYISSASAGCFIRPPEDVYVSNQIPDKIYIIRVDEILEYSFALNKPMTKLRVTIINSVDEMGQDSGQIDININGGVVSIFELENSSLDYQLDSKYIILTTEEKKNTFVRLISENDYDKISVPEVGKYYIVSLDKNNNLVTNSTYPFLEYDIENNLYKDHLGNWSTLK